VDKGLDLLWWLTGKKRGKGGVQSGRALKSCELIEKETPKDLIILSASAR
jgi:hypothetical protein